MAYASKPKPNTEHPFRTIVKLLDSDALPRVLVCHGHEEFLVNWAEKYVKNKLVEPASEALDLSVFSEELDPYSIIAACETLPILSKRKLVVVRGTDIFTQQPKDMKAEGVQVLADYLGSVPDTTMLLFTADKVNKTKALYKNAVKVGFGDGYLSAIKDLCDGAIVVDGRNLTIGNDAHMHLFQVEDGKRLTSLDMDKLDIH